MVLLLSFLLAACSDNDDRGSRDEPAADSRYLTMRDGVRIAIDAYVPEGAAADAPVPTVVRATRYWRDIEVKQRWVIPRTETEQEARRWMSRGYAFVVVDARGSGASEGTRPHPWGPDEVEDYREVVDWIIAREWSSGSVGAEGISYDGNTAEFIGSLGHEAVKAVIPRFSDFDVYGDAGAPGGIYNEGFVEAWAAGNDALDANDLCAAYEIEPDDCERVLTIVGGVKPVAGDEDKVELDAAVAQHRDNVNIYEATQNLDFRDERVGDATFEDFSPFSRHEGVERTHPAFYGWAAWLDASTVRGALNRYTTYPDSPQRLVLGPWNHGADEDGNVFNDRNATVVPDIEEQYDMMAEFLDGYLKEGGEAPTTRSIRYFTMGEDVWKTTDTWPPDGVDEQKLYLRTGLSLSSEMPNEEAPDTYRVDFTASSGESNRFWTQLGNDVYYPDRAREDEKLLTYDTEPLGEDQEITGNALVHLYLSSTHADGALFVYLEQVSPEGVVTYLTEGELRLIDRKVSEAPFWYHVGPYHSCNAADAEDMVPGEMTEVTLGLLATSVLVRAGNSLRIAIAGHDAANFRRYPAEGTPELTITHDAQHPSSITLPVVAR